MRRRSVLLAAALGAAAVAAGILAVFETGLIGRMVEPPPLDILCRDEAGCRVTALARLASAPFPITEPTEAPGRTGAAYRDDRVLIHVPPGFDPAKPFRTLLFFHGHGSRIETTIAEEYRLIEQANRSGRNLILVAPQLARDTRDSHPGKLAGRGAAARLLSDALGQAAELLGVPAPLLAGGQVIVAAYSGGWWPAAETLTRGGLDGRIAALFLLDAHYGGDAAFADWIAARRTEAVFVSIHTGSSAPGAERLLGRLIAANVEPSPELPGRLRPGTVVVAKRETPHLRVMVEGPPALPVAALLRRLPAFSDAVPDPADPAGPPEVPDNRP